MDNNTNFFEMPNTCRVLLKLTSVKLAAPPWHNWHNSKYYCLLKSGQTPICIISTFSAVRQDLATLEKLFLNPSFAYNYSFQRKAIILTGFC